MHLAKCHGQRYDKETLAVTYRDKNIAEVLDLTVEAAHEFFVDEAPIVRALDALLQVGLGYLRLGQPATELSGGRHSASSLLLNCNVYSEAIPCTY